MRKLDIRSFLAPLPRSRLQALAESLGLSADKDLIPKISATLSDPDTVRGILEEIPPESLDLLRTICYCGLYDFISSDETQIKTASFRRLYDAGLVGVGKEYWGTLCIVIPEETCIVIMNYFQKLDTEKLCKAGTLTVDRVRSRADATLRNITTMISVAEVDGIPLTAHGEISKPFLTKRILPIIETGDYGLSPDSRYPLDFYHAWRFCHHFEILKTAGAVVVPGPMADSFLDTTDDVLCEALLTYIMETESRCPVRWLVETLRALPATAWVESDRIVETGRPVRLGRKEEVEYSKVWSQALELMEMMGLLDTGLAGDKKVLSLGRIWRDEQEPRLRTDELILTPDFKISAPRNLIRSLRSSLSKFALFVKSDLMDQWEITQASVSRAIDDGFTGQRIIDLLTEHSTFPLPKNVTDSMKIWEQNHQDVVFHNGPVLIVENPAEERFIRDVLSKENALLSNPAPNVFIIHPKKAEAVVQKIKARRSLGKIAVPRISRKEGEFSTILAARATSRKIDHDNRAHVNMLTL